MRYIIYCRKSSEAEDRQVLSIESQYNELTRLAERYNFKVEKIFKESKSAKAPGRPIFDEMMKYIEKKGEAVLLVWKLDRLARNAMDGGRLSWFMDRHLIEEIRTPEKVFTNTGDDKFMMTLDFGMAKKYVDDLSANVKRGNRTKLERGDWPNKAPLGYINNRADKSIVIDPERSPFIIKAFELYATGGYSVKDLANLFYEQGLRNRTSGKVPPSALHFALSNPFYYGVMKVHEKFYKGNHEPIISKQLYDQANDVLSGRIHSKKQIHQFPLRGFMTCESCGCMLTATTKKGHVYYYCTNGKGICAEHKKYMRSELAEQHLLEVFEKMELDIELLELAYQAAMEKTKGNTNHIDSALVGIQTQLNFASRKKEKLFDAYIAEMVSKTAYEAKLAPIEADEIVLRQQLIKLQKLQTEGGITLEPAKELILEGILAKKKFKNANDDQKRFLAEKLLWNLSISNNEVANFKLKMPYQLIAEASKNGTFSDLLRD